MLFSLNLVKYSLLKNISAKTCLEKIK